MKSPKAGIFLMKLSERMSLVVVVGISMGSSFRPLLEQSTVVSWQ